MNVTGDLLLRHPYETEYLLVISSFIGGVSVDDAVRNESGLPVQAVYDAVALTGFDPGAELGEPGEFPFTRGVYPSMYTGRPWTMRQYAGFGTAKESNERYHELVANGTGGLSVAFDLPTQMGYDSDEPVARGEVGKVGVAIDSVEDMRVLFEGLPLDKISTSMTINAPAATLLLMYQLVAGEQGIPGSRLSGTIQNDVLKEYIARGTYIYPPRESLRLISDIFAYCQREVPRWNTISISGYHMAEAGATPAQEVAFTIANAKEYVRAAIAAGLDVDDFAPRLSFFFVARTTVLEEIAKFRAARRIWARIMRDEFGAKNPKSQMLRFHTQTAGVQLTAQQPEVNLVRVALQALAAVLGGTQSLHTNSYDEAIALPSEKAARLALRTQQVIAYETDVTKIVDPLAGSYAIESMTGDLEAAALSLINAVEDRGGAVAAIEQGFQKNEIEASAYRVAKEIDDGTRTVVGVNKFVTSDDEPYEPLRVDPRIEADQRERLAVLRAERDNAAVTRALDALRAAAEGTGNVLPPMREALELRATGGEVAHALRDVWGVYQPRDSF
jgi:methylmalonyl-CoA mutase N-terminal domain/subunit